MPAPAGGGSLDAGTAIGYGWKAMTRYIGPFVLIALVVVLVQVALSVACVLHRQLLAAHDLEHPGVGGRVDPRDGADRCRLGRADGGKPQMSACSSTPRACCRTWWRRFWSAWR